MTAYNSNSQTVLQTHLQAPMLCRPHKTCFLIFIFSCSHKLCYANSMSRAHKTSGQYQRVVGWQSTSQKQMTFFPSCCQPPEEAETLFICRNKGQRTFFLPKKGSMVSGLGLLLIVSCHRMGLYSQVAPFSAFKAVPPAFGSQWGSQLCWRPAWLL